MLERVELLELEEALREEFEDNLTEILIKLNYKDELGEFLGLLGLSHLLERNAGYQVSKAGKIVVVGQSDVKADILLGIGKSLGISKDRFELHLEYEDAEKIDFSKMQWMPSYSAILVGKMPHSGVSKGEHGSIISAIENEPGYPPVVRLGQNELKISKTNFRKALQDLIQKGKIA